MGKEVGADSGGKDITCKDTEKVTAGSKKSKCCKCIFWTLSITVAVAAVGIGLVYYNLKGIDIPQEVADHLGPEGIQLFLAYDRDGDGYLSISEFEALYHKLANNSSHHFEIPAYEQIIDEDDESVTVIANFQPLLLETMTREKDEHQGFFQSSVQDTLYGLKNWKEPNIPFADFGVRHFSAFFPKNPAYSVIGSVEPLIHSNEGIMDMISGDLSSNRYFPPQVEENNVVIHRLLAMFHRHPFIMTRFKPRGAYKLLRARNDEYLDIMFRIHAEYQLNEPPNNPFWFTPGQFTGHLIVTRDLKHILHFNMFVPTNRKLNVDMEWLEGTNNMVVDIGYMPEMNLTINGPSLPVSNQSPQQPGQQPYPDKIVWTEEIDEKEALQRLEREMFPFKEVKYHNFTESLELAKQENKLVHSILLWGALDDQSC